MSNVIRFEIETDAPYTPKEKADLLDSLLAFMQEEDDDVIEGTEEIEILPAGASESTITQEQKQNIIQEFLDEANITARLNITNDGIGMETTLKV